MGSYSPNPKRLAILETDTPVSGIKAKYGSYGGVFQNLFERALAETDPTQSSPAQLEFSFYDVVSEPNRYPKPEDIDAVLITGSKASAYENVEWILRLVEYVKGLLDGGRVRVIGVCFGHQILGRVLGAKVCPNRHGWELSVTDVGLNATGKKFFRRDKLRIPEMHRDIVVDLPLAISNIAQTGFCTNQAFYRPGRWVSVQGHPEFTEEMVTEILDMRRGILPPEAYNSAMERVGREHDGVAIAQAFLRFLSE